MPHPFQALFQGVQLTATIATLLSILPGLYRAIMETYEAVKASGSDADDAVKVKEAVEAGQAWLDIAVTQLQLKPEVVSSLRDKFIPAMAELLFHGDDSHG